MCELALVTGWRVDDILSLTTEQVKKCLESSRHKLTITEMKTKKKSSKTIPVELLRRLVEQSGIVYCFEGRDDYRKHRTRQAVFIDLKKSAKRFKININLAPHSLRKNYAVYLREQGKTAEQIKKELNHNNITTTLLYMLADELNQKYRKK